MPRYKVLKDYEAGDTVERITKGQEVILDEDLAAWIERDSPDTLKEIKEPKPKDREAKAVQDRQVKKKRKPKAGKGTGGEAITRANFGAVKNKE